MSLKSWVLDRVQRINGLAGRADLPAREPAFQATPGTPSRAGPRVVDRILREPAHEPMLPSPEHLGAYGPLIAAVRDELEHFIASHVRLHLAIADRDRFVLTSIGVGCADAAEARQLLRQFMHEFKPEQVKRYLAREVIGGLPNASAIDLSQFVGLIDADARETVDDGGEYKELLAALRSTPVAVPVRPYQVNVLGRWVELDGGRPAVGSVRSGALPMTPMTPLAGARCEFDVEDADGRRRVVLQSVVPGRRYVIGKGEGCDIRVNGSYTSRWHAEIWLDHDAWWVSDAGSTNGVRVEPRSGAHSRSGPSTSAAVEPPIRLPEGARIVLSARAEGMPGEYPWLAMRPPVDPIAARVTPIASVGAIPKTPLTAVLPPEAIGKVLKLTALLAGGVRTLELRSTALPVTVGRSRNQTLVIDRRHEEVSGHHVDIVDLDESGAQIVVHGDNGVLIEGVPHPTGARLRWKVGETMVLGPSAYGHQACTLLLAHQDRS
jgi:pSer/pThr/pTyr-binding forkhead associated (FHA) protein